LKTERSASSNLPQGLPNERKRLALVIPRKQVESIEAVKDCRGHVRRPLKTGDLWSWEKFHNKKNCIELGSGNCSVSAQQMNGVEHFF